MCDFRIWYQADEDMYVLQCIECNTYQVRFHNTAFLFDSLCYKAFRDSVTGANARIEAGLGESSFIIPAFDTGVDILLKEPELRKLYFLLDAADTEMKAARMAYMVRNGINTENNFGDFLI